MDRPDLAALAAQARAFYGADAVLRLIAYVRQLEAQHATLRAALEEMLRRDHHTMLCGGWHNGPCDCYLRIARAALAEEK